MSDYEIHFVLRTEKIISARNKDDALSRAELILEKLEEQNTDDYNAWQIATIKQVSE